jgi:hypothetical protein
MRPGYGEQLIAEGDVGIASDHDRLVEEFRRGEVFGNFADTFYRFGVGVALSIVVGILVGVLIGALAGVVVAALKEAFDRDSARMEMERAQLESERQRAEEALRAELRRQAGERALAQLRMIAVMSIGLWALSAALSVWLPGMRDGFPRALLGTGWVLAISALAAAFAGWQYISRWSADMRDTGAAGPAPVAAAAAPWLLIAALALTGASLLTAL